MTKTQAGLLADMLPITAREVLVKLGRVDMDGIAEATVDYLKSMKLIEQTTSLLGGKIVWVLTRDGKKVRGLL
ncbi:MAG: hypothetical protein JWQ87_5404 [Candidatus Sulfotelmatobacter sp.]|nr:hypothetical protein [Candidatus Sulfotelmatobacter sp.]